MKPTAPLRPDPTPRFPHKTEHAGNNQSQQDLTDYLSKNGCLATGSFGVAPLGALSITSSNSSEGTARLASSPLGRLPGRMGCSSGYAGRATDRGTCRRRSLCQPRPGGGTRTAAAARRRAGRVASQVPDSRPPLVRGRPPQPKASYSVRPWCGPWLGPAARQAGWPRAGAA